MNRRSFIGSLVGIVGALVGSKTVNPKTVINIPVEDSQRDIIIEADQKRLSDRYAGFKYFGGSAMCFPGSWFTQNDYDDSAPNYFSEIYGDSD